MILSFSIMTDLKSLVDSTSQDFTSSLSRTILLLIFSDSPPSLLIHLKFYLFWVNIPYVSPWVFGHVAIVQHLLIMLNFLY